MGAPGENRIVPASARLLQCADSILRIWGIAAGGGNAQTAIIHFFPPAALMTHKILIVDDQQDALDMLAALFVWHGFDAVTAKDGQRAWELLERERPDLILADYMLPKLNGLALYHRAKLHPQTKDIPFMLMSGVPLTVKPSAAHAVLTKPIQFDALLDEVHKAVGSRGQTAPLPS